VICIADMAVFSLKSESRDTNEGAAKIVPPRNIAALTRRTRDRRPAAEARLPSINSLLALLFVVRNRAWGVPSGVFSHFRHFLVAALIHALPGASRDRAISNSRRVKIPVGLPA